MPEAVQNVEPFSMKLFINEENIMHAKPYSVLEVDSRAFLICPV
jgi:hypothetical protein